VYDGGLCLVFRLTPADYHRYIYPDNGCKTKNTKIAGKLHTVKPIALGKVPVFTTNSREYSILRTENFDDIVFMEVGAMMVGRICNYHEEHAFSRGEEKGKFEFDNLRNSWGFGIRVRRPDMYFFRFQLGFHGIHGIHLVMTIAPEFQ
jgi:phosphatidylserine decarboxylase